MRVDRVLTIAPFPPPPGAISSFRSLTLTLTLRPSTVPYFTEQGRELSGVTTFHHPVDVYEDGGGRGGFFWSGISVMVSAFFATALAVGQVPPGSANEYRHLTTVLSAAYGLLGWIWGGFVRRLLCSQPKIRHDQPDKSTAMEQLKDCIKL